MSAKLDEAWLAAHPIAQPDGDTDKNARGRIVVVGGSRFVPGALRLTGEAALRAGAGKLQLGTIAEVALLLGMSIPEAGVFGLPADAEGELDAAAAPDVVEQARSCDTLIIGPGMRVSEGTAALLRRVVQGLPDDVALVLDAAAIAACRDCREVIRSHAGPVILTPHHGEMAALTGLEKDAIRNDPGTVAREVAADLRAFVVLKDSTTVIAGPAGEALVFEEGTAGLATGGSGDVLAGILGGLLARGSPPLTAAGWAVWTHGAVGCKLTEQMGGLGLLGRELLPLIPATLNRVTPAGGGSWSE